MAVQLDRSGIGSSGVCRPMRSEDGGTSLAPRGGAVGRRMIRSIGIGLELRLSCASEGFASSSISSSRAIFVGEQCTETLGISVSVYGDVDVGDGNEQRKSDKT